MPHRQRRLSDQRQDDLAADVRGLVETRLDFDIHAQPDDLTCGPTCLHAVYQFFGDAVPLEQVVREVHRIDHGGTIAVFLASHALARGYTARIFTYNLAVFDPTWFTTPGCDLAERLRRQARAKRGRKLRRATEGYQRYLELGGKIQFEDLTPELIRRYLRRGLPILTGLSSTYLYGCAREYGPEDEPDDVRGQPGGHFVVLAGYDPSTQMVRVADPYLENPLAPGHHYDVPFSRVICAILLGVLTYDANLLVLQPSQRSRRRTRGSRS